VDGQTTIRTAGFVLQVHAPSTLAVTGRVLTAKAVPQPIPGITVTLGSAFTLTDAAGNFVLLAPPAGANMLLVDRRTASTPAIQYPAVEVNINVGSSGPTRVPFVVYLPKLDTAHPVTLPLDRRVHDPAGAGDDPHDSRTRGDHPCWHQDHRARRESGVTDHDYPGAHRPEPHAVPAGGDGADAVQHPAGGLVPSQPLPITFPNVQNAPPGVSAQLYFFDLVVGGWAVWGTGTVNADGTLIVSDPGAGLPRFAWHYPYVPSVPTSGSLSDQAGPLALWATRAATPRVGRVARSAVKALDYRCRTDQVSETRCDKKYRAALLSGASSDDRNHES